MPYKAKLLMPIIASFVTTGGIYHFIEKDNEYEKELAFTKKIYREEILTIGKMIIDKK